MKEEREYIIEELKALAPRLAELKKDNAFRVPDGYFPHLHAVVLSQIQDIELQANIPASLSEDKKASMDVPTDYFDNLQDAVLNRIAQEEIEELPAKLVALRKNNPFRIPEGYFEQLGESVRLKREAQDTPKIIRMFTPKLGLIAAALTGVILTVFLLRNPQATPEWANINEEDVMEYLVDHIDEFGEEDLIPLVNDRELGQLNWNGMEEEDIEQYLTDEEVDLDLNEIL